MSKNDTGVFQLDNGYWGYRVRGFSRKFYERAPTKSNVIWRFANVRTIQSRLRIDHRLRGIYLTFAKCDGRWRYYGNCFPWETIDKTYY